MESLVNMYTVQSLNGSSEQWNSLQIVQLQYYYCTTHHSQYSEQYPWQYNTSVPPKHYDISSPVLDYLLTWCWTCPWELWRWDQWPLLTSSWPCSGLDCWSWVAPPVGPASWKPPHQAAPSSSQLKCVGEGVNKYLTDSEWWQAVWWTNI